MQLVGWLKGKGKNFKILEMVGVVARDDGKWEFLKLWEMDWDQGRPLEMHG